MPGFRAAILGPDGAELGPGEPGRLGVIGPVGCRYLDDERQRNYVSSGWNVTGDIFYRDADGYFYYHARSDDMIVSSGYNIGGPEVEAAIDTHPDVLESAVVARPDAERGSVVCAFVVLRPGVTGDAAKAKEIQDHVKHVLAPYKYPRDVRFTAALPRNASGKLQRFALRQIVENEQASTSAGAAPAERKHREDRDHRRRPGRPVPRRPDEAARPRPRDHRLGAQRPGRHVRLRRGVLRRDPRRHRERRHRVRRRDGAAGSPAGPTSTSTTAASATPSAARASPR